MADGAPQGRYSCFLSSRDLDGPSLGVRFGSSRASLMRVSRLDEGSPADEAGVSVGTVVLAFGDSALRGPSSTRAAAKQLGPLTLHCTGSNSLTVFRHGKQMLGMTLSAMSPVSIRKVEPGSLGQRLGLIEGDELLSVNGTFCPDAASAASLVSQSSGPICLEVRLPRAKARRSSLPSWPSASSRVERGLPRWPSSGSNTDRSNSARSSTRARLPVSENI